MLKTGQIAEVKEQSQIAEVKEQSQIAEVRLQRSDCRGENLKVRVLTSAI
jgi:hypothetical protein